MTALKNQHGGFVLPAVVFLIVVLGGAAIAIAQLTADNTGSNNQALQQARARLMAQSAIDVAVHRLVTDNSTACSDAPGFPADNFPGLSVSITCEENIYGSEGVALWNIIATASSDSLNTTDPEYVWQRQRATVELGL